MFNIFDLILGLEVGGLFMRSEWKKKGLSAFIVFTLVFTIFTIFPGNAGAVIVEINGLDPTYQQGEIITIIAEVLIEYIRAHEQRRAYKGRRVCEAGFQGAERFRRSFSLQ